MEMGIAGGGGEGGGGEGGGGKAGAGGGGWGGGVGGGRTGGGSGVEQSRTCSPLSSNWLTRIGHMQAKPLKCGDTCTLYPCLHGRGQGGGSRELAEQGMHGAVALLWGVLRGSMNQGGSCLGSRVLVDAHAGALRVDMRRRSIVWCQLLAHTGWLVGAGRPALTEKARLPCMLHDIMRTTALP
eukprot:7391630-Prymnesium_polylepis.2